MKVETKKQIKEARQAEVMAAQALSNFQTKAEEVRNNIVAVTNVLKGLEDRRQHTIDAVGHGAADEKDLQKLRKESNAKKEEVDDLEAISSALQKNLDAATRAHETAKAGRARAERRAWRELAEELAERHRPDIQALLNKVHVCEWRATEPGLLGGLGGPLPANFHATLRRPSPEESLRLMEELVAEYF